MDGSSRRTPLHASARLDALALCGLLDSPPESAFDRVTALVTSLLGVSSAFVTLVEPHRQFFKSAVGLPEPWASHRESALSHSFCQHVVAAEGPLVIEDAREHPLVCDNLAVVDWGIVSYLGVPLRAPSGEVLGTLCAVDGAQRTWSEADRRLLEDLSALLTDVIELRMKGARLEAAARLAPYELLVEGTGAYAMLVVDPDGRITMWNTGARRIFGYGEEEAVGQPCAMLYTEQDRRQGVPEEKLSTAVREGQSMHERWHVRKDGTRFWGVALITALYRADGSLRGYAKVLRDDTRRKRAEDRVQALAESLEGRVAERNRQVRELASMLTHAEQDERRRIAQVLHDDLQQTIVAAQYKLDGALQRLAEGGDARASLDVVARRLQEAWRLTRTLTADLSPPILKSEGLRDTLEWLQIQMEELHGLAVELDAPHTFRTPEEDLRLLLFGIVRELLFNVAKHAGTDHASVTLRDVDHHVEITVADEGRGFDVAAAEAAAAERTNGGFGLFSVRERLRLFGGSLRVDSAPGEGTRVTVSVPLRFG